ncbi:MAG: LytR/AlgR family response regulator transcription factor [Gemmatimonas sp.]
MKVAVLVVDDEPIARAGLMALLSAYEWIEIVGEAADGEAAVRAIDALKPELVFLDVQMPGLLGTEVLRQITHRPFVVFTTAYSQHAVTAFELGAADYLVKPFGRARLAATMDRIQRAIGSPTSADSIDRLGGVLGSGPISRLFARSGNNIVPIALEHVSRIEADGDYVVVHAGSSRHLLHLSLAGLVSRLDPERFLQTHRAHVVNLSFVRTFRRDAKGNLEAEMTDGTRVPVSRSRAQEIRNLGR